MAEEENRYPLKLSVNDAEQIDATLRFMTPEDEAAILAFAKGLPLHDLLYVRRDITNPKVVSAWVRSLANGSIKTLLAETDDGIIGCVALIRDPYSWSPHLGELRVLVSDKFRQKGLGRSLIQEGFRMALADDLKKLIAHMTVDQVGAVAIFEELGFRGEALLKEHVMDRDGETHDIVILSCDVDRVHNQMSAYGVDAAGHA